MKISDPEYKILFEKALSARQKALASFSNYAVGAALVTENGEIFTGANVEIKAIGESYCAEKVALTKALSSGVKKEQIKILLVVADNQKICSPCGSCRQLIWEINPVMKILMTNLDGEIIEKNIQELLPYPHSIRNLKN